MLKRILSIIFLNILFYQFSYAKIDIRARTVILQDFLSGEILYEKEADDSIYPASMTKIMTSIIAFDLIKSGDLQLDEKFIISEKAWRLSTAGYSSMFVMVGDEVSVENLLKGIIVASGNDACIALAEGIAGTEEEFAIMMTAKAKELGMKNTNFANSSGINDPDNYSTVRDILIMSNYLIKEHPDYYEWFKEKEFTWDRTGGDPITQGNRNPLLYKNIGADGIKTGYLAVEKYSLASSLKRNGRRLIAVGSGFETKNSRSRESSKLLTYGLTNFDVIEIARANTPLDKVEVWLGKENQLEVYVNQDIYKTIKKAQKRKLKISTNYNGPVEAPIKKDQKIGILKVVYDQNLIGEYECKVDAKGRLLVPSGLRKQFSPEAEGKLFVKRGIENCLELYQKHDWEFVSEKVSGLNQFVKKNRAFARKFISGATQLELDSVGRINLPKNLLEYAGVKKELILFAYGNKIEIWDKAAYDAELEMSDNDFADLAEEVMGEVNLDE